MEKESVAVNCSFCSTAITCPPDQLDAKYHCCHGCFVDFAKNKPPKELKNVHVDIPTDKFSEVMGKMLVTELVEKEFPEIWKEMKDEFKEYGKKDIAREMFAAGASLVAEHFLGQMQEAMKNPKSAEEFDDDSDEDDSEDDEQEQLQAG